MTAIAQKGAGGARGSPALCTEAGHWEGRAGGLDNWGVAPWPPGQGRTQVDRSPKMGLGSVCCAW